MRYLTTTFSCCGASCGPRRLRRRRRRGSVPGDAVAKVDGTTITQQQFNDLLDQAKRTYKTQKRKFPDAGRPSTRRLKNQAVQYLVQRVEFAQEADKLGVKVTDKEIAARLAQIKKQYFGGSESRYKKQLKPQGLTEAQVTDDIKAQLVSGEDLQEGHGQREGHRRGRQEVLRPAPVPVRHARAARRRAHPRQDQSARRQALHADQGGRGLRRRSRRSTRRIRARRTQSAASSRSPRVRPSRRSTRPRSCWKPARSRTRSRPTSATTSSRRSARSSRPRRRRSRRSRRRSTSSSCSRRRTRR